MHRLTCIFMIVLLLAHGAVVRAEVSASIDRDGIRETESFDLTIRSDRTLSASDPDLAPLTQDFEVLGNSQSTNVSIINGKRTAYTEWRVSLLPKRSGILRIPGIDVGSEQTQALTITVAPDAPAATSATQDVMLEVETDVDEVHVQQQLLLTVRVLHAVNLNRGAALSEPEIANAVVRKLAENSHEKIVNGRRYGVFERRYAIYPQASGELRLPALAFEASVGTASSFFDQFTNRGRTLRLRSTERSIRVLPPLAGATTWLPARMLTIVETWDRSPQQLHVGESATRTVTITANGLTGAQLPPLPTADVKGLRFYPDQARISDQQDDDGITGTREESTAVIPLASGDIEFPEVRVRWWDTQKQRFEDAVVPGKTIRVAPATGGTQPSATPQPAPADGAPATTPQLRSPTAQFGDTPGAVKPWAWMAISALLGLTTLVASWQWWRLARRSGQPPTGDESPRDPREKDLFKALRQACQSGNSQQAQALLIDWARVAFPNLRIQSFADITHFAADPLLQQAIQTLLASRYGSSAAVATWQGDALLARLDVLRARSRQKPGTGKSQSLPALYEAA